MMRARHPLALLLAGMPGAASGAAQTLHWNIHAATWAGEIAFRIMEECTGGPDTITPLIGKAARAVFRASNLGETDAHECRALITRCATLRLAPDA